MYGKAIMVQALTNRRVKLVYHGTIHSPASAQSYVVNVYISLFSNLLVFPKSFIISPLYQSKQTKPFKIHSFYSHAQPKTSKLCYITVH